MGQILSIVRDELRGLSRYRWQGMIAAWSVCALGWAAVMSLPNQYESSARLFVDTRTALSAVIQGLAVEDDINAYLNLAKESLVGEARLQKVLAETSLDDSAGGPTARAKLVDKLRSNIVVTVEPTGDRTRQPQGVIYSIKYRDSDRDRSLKVVNLLLNGFIETTLGGKRQSSATAEEFLTKQIGEYEARLRDAEQRLAEFKKSNVGVMPGVEGDYFTRLQNEMDALNKARTALSVAVARRDALAQQRRTESPFSVGAGAAGNAGNGANAGSDTQSQLADAQRRLAALLLRFTDKHPDVAAVREEIAGLERRRARELDALKHGDVDAALASGAGTNPIYQSIQLQLNQVDVQIAELRGEIGQHERKIAELRAFVNTVPEVEAQFARLNRDYEVTRTQYAALVERLKKAQLGQDAEATTAVRFEVIDPPGASLKPVSPNRPLLVVAVFAVGVIGGLGLAYLMHRQTPVFNRARELYAELKVPVLGEVGLTTVGDAAAIERRVMYKLAGSAAGLFAVFLCIAYLSTKR